MANPETLPREIIESISEMTGEARTRLDIIASSEIQQYVTADPRAWSEAMIEHWAWIWAQAVTAADDAMCAALLSGMSIAEIARVSQLGNDGVAKRLAKHPLLSAYAVSSGGRTRLDRAGIERARYDNERGELLGEDGEARPQRRRG